MADEQIIVDISYNTADADKNVTNLTNSIVDLDVANQKLNDSIKEAQRNLKKTDDDLKKEGLTREDLTNQLKENSKQVEINKSKIQKEKLERQSNIKFINAEENSRESLRLKIVAMTKERNNLNLSTVEGSKRSEELRLSINKLNDEYKESGTELEQNKLNIGNYTESIINAVKELREQENQIKKNLIALEKVNNSNKTSEEDQVKVTLAIAENKKELVKVNNELSKYGDNLDIVDAEIVSVSEVSNKYLDVIKSSIPNMGKFGDVVNISKKAMSSYATSQKVAAVGTGGLSKAMGVLKIALISTGIGAIVVALGLLIAAFTKTTEGTNKLTKMLDQAKATVNAVLGRITRLGEALVKALHGDFKGAIEETKKAFEGLNAEISATITEAGRIADLRVQYKLNTREVEKQIAVLQARRELEASIAEDDTRGFKEREEYYKKEAATIIEIAALKVKDKEASLELIRSEIEMRKKQNLSISDEQLDALKDAQIAIIEAENEKVLVTRDSAEKRRRSIRDLREYELDVLIDTFDKQKTINEGIIKDASKSYEERKSLLDETVSQAASSYEEQKRIVEDFSGKKLDFDALVMESDAKIISEKLKAADLDDIMYNRSREIIQERKILLNDFSILEKQLADESIATEQAKTEKNRILSEDELKRKKDSLEKIRQFELEDSISKAETADEERKLKIENETLEYERVIENKELLYEELELLKMEHDARLIEIDAEYTENQRAAALEQVRIAQESINTILESAGQFADDRVSIASDMSAKLAELTLASKDGDINKLELVSVAAQGLSDMIISTHQKQLTNLEEQKAAELALVGDNTEQREAIEKKFAKKTADLKAKQFKQEKAIALVNVAVNTALGITKSLAQLGPIAGAIAAIGVGIAGGVQAGIILSKKEPPTPTFKQGGEVKFTKFGGRSHAMGGVDGKFSDGTKINVQKDELMFILNKNASSQLDYLHNLNNRYPDGKSSKRNYFKPGGEVGLNGEDMTANFRAAIQDLTVITRVEDISTGLTNRQKVLNNAVV